MSYTWQDLSQYSLQVASMLGSCPRRLYGYMHGLWIPGPYHEAGRAIGFMPGTSDYSQEVKI